MSHDEMTLEPSDMTSRDKKLIRMGNQIATFFSSQNDAELEKKVAEHINKFWEPRMRLHLFEIAERSTDGFHELFKNAVPYVNRPNA